MNPEAIARLSPRCAQVFDGIVRGLAEKQIARELGISRHTVHVYVKAVYRHFGADGRACLMGMVVRGLVERLAAAEAGRSSGPTRARPARRGSPGRTGRSRTRRSPGR